MANKLTNRFTKSVLEREQKEQRTATTIQSAEAKAIVAPVPETSTPVWQAANTTAPSVVPPAQISAEENPVTISKPVAEKSPKKVVTPIDLNLDAFLNRNESRQAKNKTFYLDTAVINALKRAATANGIAESKLVNDILKKVLGV